MNKGSQGEEWCEGQNRDWVIVALSPRAKSDPSQAYVYPCPENRQRLARQQITEMMGNFERCLESGRWETYADQLAEQPAPSSVYDWRADYVQHEIEMNAKPEDVPWKP